MEIRVTGTAIIEHSETGVRYEIENDLLSFEGFGGEEAPMGAREQYRARLEHDDLGMLEWNVTEYPVNTLEDQSSSIGSHKFIEEFEISFEHEPEFEEPQILFSATDAEGISIDLFKTLSEKEQVPYLVHWFNEMFEDPQNETPYSQNENSSSNYEYIWGGPYDAREQLADWFTNIASEEAIEKAAKDVENEHDVYEWAPGPKHPDHQRAAAEHRQSLYEDDQEPQLDEIRRRLKSGQFLKTGDLFLKSESPTAIQISNELGDEISQLREQLTKLSEYQHVGLGHNNPPDAIQIDVNLTIRIEEQLEVLEAETTTLEPAPESALEATGKLKVIANEVRSFAAQCYAATKTTAAAAVATTIVGGLTAIILAIAGKLDVVVQLATQWLDAITAAF